MKKIIFLLNLVYTKLRFCYLLSENQSLKSNLQIAEKYKDIDQIFNPAAETFDITKTGLIGTQRFDVFMYLDGKKIAAFLEIEKIDVFDQKLSKLVPFLCIYMVSVPENYRSQKLSTKLFLESITF